MSDYPRVPSTEGEGFRQIVADPQEAVPAHYIDTPTGPMLVMHGYYTQVTKIVEGAGQRIGLIVGVRGCDCGCGANGRAILATPSPENARAIAAALCDVADKLEAEAAKAAAAALAKAKRS